MKSFIPFWAMQAPLSAWRGGKHKQHVSSNQLAQRDQAKKDRNRRQNRIAAESRKRNRWNK